MPYTRKEFENYQWYQDRIKARRDEYNTYLQESKDEQEDNPRQHMVDVNGVLLSFENIDEEVRLQEPFRRAGLDDDDQRIKKTNQYPLFSKGQKFDITIDTEFSQLTEKPTSLPSCARPTIEFATDPPETVSSIFKLDNNFLNSASSTNFIVLLVRLFLAKKLSSTLQITSTIAFPIPKIFILSFLCFNWSFSIRITSGTDFTS